MGIQEIEFDSTWTRLARYAIFLIVVGMVVLTITTGSAVGYEPETRSIDELDGSGVYAGEELSVNLSDSPVTFTAGETAYLIRFTDRPSFTVEETARIEDGGIVSGIDTDGLSTGENYAFANSTASRSAGTDGEFSLLASDFSANWNTDSVTGETSDGTVEISSSRSSDYGLTISAEGLEYEELEAVFRGGATVTEDPDEIPFERLGYEPAETTVEDVISDGYITVTDWNSGSDELRGNFSALKQTEGLPRPGEYNFEFVVTDTGQQDTSTVDIAERNEDASLNQSLYEIAAGDIVTAKIDLKDTEEAFIQISDESGFADVVYVDIDDPDKPITLQVNTRVLGTDYRSIAGLGGAYEAENVDRFVSAYHDGQTVHANLRGASPFVGTDGIGSPPEINGKPIFTDNAERLTYQQYLTRSGYIESGNKTTMLERPLQPTNYQIEVAGIANVGEEGVFDADQGGPTDRIERSTIVLETPSVSNISVYQLSGGDASDVNNIVDVPTANATVNNISHGDRIVVQVDLTGIFGAIAAGGPNHDIDTERIGGSFDTELLTELIKTQNGFEFSIEEVERIGNTEPTAVVLDSGSDSTYAVSDYSNERVFLVIDTEATSAFNKDLPSEQTLFTINAKYDANITEERYRFKDRSPLGGPFSSERENANHPYLPVGEERQDTQPFTLGPPRLSYNNEFDDEVRVLHNSQVSLNGTTNIRAGTEGRLEIVSENDPSNVAVVDLNIRNERFTTEPFNGSEFAQRAPVTIRHVVEGRDIDPTRGRIVSEYGNYNELNNLGAERPESGATESVTGGSTEEPSSVSSRTDQSQGTNPTDGDNIGLVHLLAVALFSFIGGTMLGVKIK